MKQNLKSNVRYLVSKSQGRSPAGAEMADGHWLEQGRFCENANWKSKFKENGLLWWRSLVTILVNEKAVELSAFFSASVFTAKANSQPLAYNGTVQEGMGQPAVEEQEVREAGFIQIGIIPSYWKSWWAWAWGHYRSSTKARRRTWETACQSASPQSMERSGST